MIASLPMYWRAETAPLWLDFWAELQAAMSARGLTLPALIPPKAIPDLKAHWLSPDLALSMTCGLPFRSFLRGKVAYIGTLGFGLDAPPGHYHSTVIARTSSGPHNRLAYNSADSQSGWAVTQHAAPFPDTPTFGSHIETGAHAASLAAVANDQADVAYIDSVTWRLLQRYDPNAAHVRVIGTSIPTPALPLIAAKGTDPAPLRAALTDVALKWQSADPMAMGGPLSFHVLSEQAYFDVPLPAPPP